MTGKYVFIIAIHLLSTTLLCANQSVMLNVITSKKTLNLNDTLRYEIQLKGLDTNTKPTLNPPQLESYFAVISSNESTYFSMINGKTSYTKSYIYTLKPYKTGSFVIPAAKMVYKGKTYTSDTINITVKEQTNIPSNQANTSTVSESVNKAAQNYNIFAQAIASKEQAYVGEQIIYQVKFFRRIRIYSDINYTNPSLDNFWAEDLTINNQDQTTTIQGKTFYERDIIHKSLFGLSAGKHTIDGPRISFILNPFGGAQTLQVNPLQLNIIDLPTENKPANFTGLVGNFTLSMEKPSNEIKNNTPLTLYITVTGQGNIKNISELNFKKNSQLKIYKSSIKNNILNDAGISGSRTFEYIVVPQETGKIQLPAFSLNFFSPESKTYQEVKTDPLTLNVMANPDYNPSETDLKMINNTQEKPTGLNYLKNIQLKQKNRLFGKSTWHKIFLLLNILSLLTFYIVRFRQLIYDKFTLKQGKKYQQKQLLKRLLNYNKQEKIPLSSIHNSYLDYLSLLLGNHAKGASKQEIISKLKQSNITEQNIDRLLTLWDDLNIANYTAENISSSDKQAFIERLIQIIKQNQENL